jgi:dTDP-4-amino-4,6-dideoxygalactose transaminase
VGIVAVHLYGEPAPMAELRTLAERHHLFLVEDAAQAQGAMYMGRRAGALSNGGAFSFYPSKNLGALGDAGAVTTDDAAIAESVRRHRAYGGQGNGRLDHILMGHNSRLDELQAAVLRVKLRHLDAMNAARRERAALYRAALDGHCGLGLPPENGGSVYHQFVVRSRERDALRQRLAVAGVDAHVHYPVPPHLEQAYRWRWQKPLLVSERLARRVLSLPIGNDIDAAQIGAIVARAARDLERISA